MPESLAPLVTSKLKLRAATKGLSVEELEKLMHGLSDVLASAKRKEQDKAKSAKQANIAKIKALMADAGLDPKDLKSPRTTRKKRKVAAKTRKVAAKYRLVVNGVEHLWSGRGRPPQAFSAYFKAGNTKDSCAI